MSGTNAIVLLFLIVGFLFSFYYGLRAGKIFRVDTTGQRFHQFWLNFLGSALGWFLLGFGLARVLQCIDQCPNPITLWDTMLLFAGFVGVTGYLPMATVGLIQHLVGLVKRHAGDSEPK